MGVPPGTWRRTRAAGARGLAARLCPECPSGRGNPGGTDASLPRALGKHWRGRKRPGSCGWHGCQSLLLCQCRAASESARGSRSAAALRNPRLAGVDSRRGRPGSAAPSGNAEKKVAAALLVKNGSPSSPQLSPCCLSRCSSRALSSQVLRFCIPSKNEVQNIQQRCLCFSSLALLCLHKPGHLARFSW